MSKRKIVISSGKNIISEDKSSRKKKTEENKNSFENLTEKQLKFVKDNNITNPSDIYELLFLDIQDKNLKDMIFSNPAFEESKLKLKMEDSNYFGDETVFAEGEYPCKKCHSRFQRYLFIQKRSGDEGTSVKIICKCGNQWIKN